MILYVSRLFFVSLVPWIDKPWGNTLREKLHDPCAWGIQIGALRSVNRYELCSKDPSTVSLPKSSRPGNDIEVSNSFLTCNCVYILIIICFAEWLVGLSEWSAVAGVDTKINTLESEDKCSPSFEKSTKRASQFDLKLTREKIKLNSRAYRLGFRISLTQAYSK